MAIRTLTFTATPNGITPANAQKAGVQGEHNATRVIITLSPELLVVVGASNAVYRYEFIDGMGQFDTTENFLASDIDSLGVIDLPNGWTSAGGQAELRLVIAQLDIDSNEELVLYSFPCRLLFEGRDTGTGTTQANLEKGLSGLIAETVESASNADVAAANANNVAGAVLAAEDLRVTAETNRVDAESGRASAEGLRSTAETGRASAESSRVTSENGRANAENIRNTSEGQRNTAEGNRNTAEGTRQQNESSRITAEGLREQGEVARQTAYGEAETARDGLYNTAELSRNSEYDNAEAARQSLYSTAEDARDSNYDATETARNNSYGAAEAGRDSQYDTAETQRNTDYNSAELVRDGLYGTAEQDRDSIFQTAETARQQGYDEFDGRIVDIETTKADKTALSETNLRIATVDKTLTDYQNTIASININNEAKQTATGYGTVSLPANAANGQVSASVKGNTVTDENGTNSTISAGRLRSVNKNLFDISRVAKIVSMQDYETPMPTYATVSSGIITSKVGAYAQTYLLYKSDVTLNAGTYTLSTYVMADKSSGDKGVHIAVQDIDSYERVATSISNLSGYGVWERKSVTFTITSKTRVALNVQGVGVAGDYTNLNIKFKDIQLEPGTATPYAPHAYTTQYYPDCGILQSVGNANDEVSFNLSLQRWEDIQRVSDDKTLNGSLMWGDGTDLGNVYRFSLSNDFIDSDFTPSGSGRLVINTVEWLLLTNFTANYEHFYMGSTSMIIMVNKTTVDAYAGATVIEKFKAYINAYPVTLTYQLASPIITPIDVTGTLIAHPNGTVYWEPVLPVAGVYTSTGIAITNTTYPIESIESISKIDFITGVETEVDISKAVIAVDGLSFTHPDLTADDIVFFTYFHGVEGTQPKIDVEYYDSRYVLKDSVTGKFYKIVETVANATLTRTLVEV